MKSAIPIDAHAHIDADIDRSEITKLGAFVMAVTRTLDEAEIATRRHDSTAVWGIGCHPGLKRAQERFNVDRFRQLLAKTSFVGEMGLDGRSRVAMDLQVKTLKEAFAVLRETPRMVSLHSYAATDKLIDLLQPDPPPGIILHWWLGDERQTDRAVELGCFFSINASSVTKKYFLDRIPPERILTETDHPFGDRRVKLARPGNVADVERGIGRAYGMSQIEVRRLMWSNLGRLITDVACSVMLPRMVRAALESCPETPVDGAAGYTPGEPS